MKLRAKSCSLLVVLSLIYVGVAGQSPTPDPQPPSGPQDADAPVNSEVLAAPVPSPSQVPSSLGEDFAGRSSHEIHELVSVNLQATSSRTKNSMPSRYPGHQDLALLTTGC